MRTLAASRVTAQTMDTCCSLVSDAPESKSCDARTLAEETSATMPLQSRWSHTYRAARGCYSFRPPATTCLTAQSWKCTAAAANKGTRDQSRCIRPTEDAETQDRTGDLQIFSLTLSQLSYRGLTAGGHTLGVTSCQLYQAMHSPPPSPPRGSTVPAQTKRLSTT